VLGGPFSIIIYRSLYILRIFCKLKVRSKENTSSKSINQTQHNYRPTTQPDLQVPMHSQFNRKQGTVIRNGDEVPSSSPFLVAWSTNFQNFSCTTYLTLLLYIYLQLILFFYVNCKQASKRAKRRRFTIHFFIFFAGPVCYTVVTASWKNVKILCN
jgi:hypothetical protein